MSDKIYNTLEDEFNPRFYKKKRRRRGASKLRRLMHYKEMQDATKIQRQIDQTGDDADFKHKSKRP